MFEVRKLGSSRVVCPAFGTGWGGLSPAEAANAMFDGFAAAWAAPFAFEGEDGGASGADSQAE